MTDPHDESQQNQEVPAPDLRAEMVPSSRATDSGGKLLTRGETARRLGMSESTLRRREAEGELKPTVMHGRTAMYEETRVSTIMQTVRKRWGAPEATDGATAARVFELLGQGVGLREIVQRLELAPEVVAKLGRQWAELGEGFFVGAAEARELGVACVQDVRDRLTEAHTSVESAVGRMQMVSPDCRVCKEAGSGVCVECYREMKQRAYGYALTAETLRLEQRMLPDGTEEVRLLAENCDVSNLKVRNSCAGQTLRTEWENPANVFFHWVRVFSDEYAGALTPPLPR